MTSKHTPGPWVAGKDGKHRAWIADLHHGEAVWTERRFKDGESYEWGERSADSALIASAPDMYAAIQLLWATFDETHPGHEAVIEREAEDAASDERHPSTARMHEQAFAAARAAIAKAEGRS